MKKLFIYLTMASLVLAGCAKDPKTGKSDAAKKYFDAWMSVNHPDLQPTALGAYVLEEKEGSGALVGDYKQSEYVRVQYTKTDLAGNISFSTREDVAKQLGTYDENNEYCPEIWARTNDSFLAGVDEMLTTMRIGGSKKTIVPGWLLTKKRYKSAADYVLNESGTNAIYDVEVVETIGDIKKWEIDSIGRYMARNFPSKSLSDSLMNGFYYIQQKAPTDTNIFKADTTLYINYVGRLLNGKIFDTNVEDTARVYGLYSSSRTYEPMQINWPKEGEDYTKLTMTAKKTETIKGFAYALWHMRHDEKGVAIFYSPLGYESKGSGSAIPGYSPLRFDIEFVKNK